PGFGLLRWIVLLPWAIPLVAAGVIWRLLVHGNFGALNGLLLQLGLIKSYVPFLSDPTLALLAVALAQVWREFPLAAILFLAGLLALFILAPFAWVLSASFQPESAIFKQPPDWLPRPLSLDNYVYVFTGKVPFKTDLSSGITAGITGEAVFIPRALGNTAL